MNCKFPVAVTLLVLMSIASFSSHANEQKGTSGGKKELEVKVKKNAATVKISATGKSGYHCNTLYPWKLTVDGPGQEKKIYKKADAKKFSKEKVVFEVPSKKGQKAKMKMSVCNDKQCIMHTEELSW